MIQFGWAVTGTSKYYDTLKKLREDFGISDVELDTQVRVNKSKKMFYVFGLFSMKAVGTINTAIGVGELYLFDSSNIRKIKKEANKVIFERFPDIEDIYWRTIS